MAKKDSKKQPRILKALAAVLLAIPPLIGIVSGNQNPGNDQGSVYVVKPESQHEAITRVMIIQMQLKNEGFDPGPIDGIMGTHTVGAIRQFQRSRRLPETGTTDEETLKALGIKARTSRFSPTNLFKLS